jgi:hypothetical protein
MSFIDGGTKPSPNWFGVTSSRVEESYKTTTLTTRYNGLLGKLTPNLLQSSIRRKVNKKHFAFG